MLCLKEYECLCQAEDIRLQIVHGHLCIDVHCDIPGPKERDETKVGAFIFLIQHSTRNKVSLLSHASHRAASSNASHNVSTRRNRAVFSRLGSGLVGFV